jgi:hypothetical protein
MEVITIFSRMGIAALLAILVSTLPVLAAGAYLFSPTERRLAMMRPISLAGIFASLGGTTLGAINTLRMFWIEPPREWPIFAISTAESLVPLFFGFSCLTVAWLCVAVGMRRQP